MGADAPYPEYDERRHPANGRPCGGSSAVFMSVILKKLPCPARPRRGGRAIPSGVGHIRNEI